jgi:hypothetical protein
MVVEHLPEAMTTTVIASGRRRGASPAVSCGSASMRSGSWSPASQPASGSGRERFAWRERWAVSLWLKASSWR